MSMLARGFASYRLNHSTWIRSRTLTAPAAHRGATGSLWQHFRLNPILVGLLGGSAGALYLCNTPHQTIHLDKPSNSATCGVFLCCLQCLFDESTFGSVDPATSIAFPVTLQPPSSPPLTLIGLGVRTVSFLRIKVYSVAFYADMRNIEVRLCHVTQFPVFNFVRCPRPHHLMKK